MGRGTYALCVVFTALGYLAGDARAEDWKDAARQAQLSSGDIQQLGRDKILITKGHCRQVFCPYVEPEMAVFITSDSILNAYHVLLEESVLQLEQANSEKLPALLEFLWNDLAKAEQGVGGNAVVLERAKRHAQIVVGTALDLLRRRRKPSDAKTEELIRTEVGRVEKATGCYAPSWLGKADNEYQIDYSRYKPRGFYTQFDSLACYFRAAAWLQSIPFRVDRDEELLAVLMLGDSITPKRLTDEAKHRQFNTYFACFREFIGDRDDCDLTIAAAAAEKFRAEFRAGDVGKVRQWLKDKAEQTKPAAINDLVLTAPLSLSFRFLSAYRTPDAIVLQRTTDPVHRPFPTGLDVAITLGSTYAAKSLNDPWKEHVLSEIEKSKPLFSGGSLYFDELHCLSTLFDRPPPNAPAFTRSEVWQSKSCTTALTGWAQLRHTWVLQAKETVVFKSDEDRPRPVGFVEPNSAFFACMAKMSARAAELLEQAHTQNDARFSTLAALQNLLRFLEAKTASGKGFRFEWQDASALDTLRQVIKDAPDELSPERAKAFYAKAIAKVRETMTEVQQGKPDGFRIRSDDVRRPVEELWRQLCEVSGHLEKLAVKELAASPFNYGAFTKDDRDFILAYGAKIAPVMFHVGHPSEVPRDDAPRIVDVFSNPDVGEVLEVGVGRPQILYMLYPTTDGEVFCRGAILPYHEFRSPTRLDDNEWKQRLDSWNPPAPPSWSIVSVAGAPGFWFGRPELHLVALGVLLIVVCAAIVARRKRNAARMRQVNKEDK
jgi:hypothetical protein